MARVGFNSRPYRSQSLHHVAEHVCECDDGTNVLNELGDMHGQGQFSVICAVVIF